ncbi:NAD(P)-dependent oxidoreductase [Actinoplanes sp. KI2]|uniref:NAD(P)-dependent oxidoreductase n=1 Tax=Actinoplanes sp. KI2 TaxID=2983315 RepID=UPI0021D5EF4E|nr:NAD(P)-dependent oxidoreductase [Actinoplanes sp. KI2]MCU7725190.1 NAD(P)-dependent oxidoreductase [Actinoplanes sp. KI2]
MSEVGWIGAGRMGGAMARRLLAAGYGVRVWNRTRDKAEALTGAKVADAPGDLAGLEVVFTTVADDASLLGVTIGEGGLLRGPASPGYLVDASTVAAETSDRVRQFAADRGTTLLAAPVSGNPKVVRAGRASIVVSGPRFAYDDVEPLLRAIGASVTYVGDGDQARLVKLAHNVLLGVVTQALAEVTVLAQRGGVPRHVFLDFLNDSVLGSTFSRYKSPALVNLDLAPTFTTGLLRKDFDLGLAAGRGLEVPMPVAAAAYQLVQAAVGRGHGDTDFAALIVEQARSAGLELEPEQVEVDDGLGS